MVKLNTLQISDSYKRFLKIFLNIAKKDRRIEQILLFGSCVKGNMHVGRDLANQLMVSLLPD